MVFPALGIHRRALMRLSIFWRLALSSLAIVAIMAGVNLYALVQVRQLTALNTELVAYHYPAIENADLLLENLYLQLRSEKQYLAVRDELFQKNFEEASAESQQLLKRIRTHETSVKGQKLLEELAKLTDRYRKRFHEKVNSNGRRSDDALLTEMTGLVRTYIDLHETKIGEVMTDARARSARVEDLTRNLGIISFFLAVGLAALASYSILRPVRRLQEQFRQIGQGNFASSVEIAAPKDLRALVDTANWMRKKLQELDNMKSDFLAHISHELRTPLASMREGTHLLLDEIPGPLSTEQRQILRIMNDSSQRLIHLISTLLDLSKMEAGMMEYQIVPTDLKRVAEVSLKRVRLLADGKRIQIVAEFPPGQLWVSMDGTRIEQVLDNLLSNALKFSPSGAAVHLRVYADFANKQVRITVSDNGPGIAAEDLPRVFDRFYQGQLHATNKLAGSGLGLALAKKVVEKHGGQIGIESELGKGTTVHFVLPMEAG
jgi:two-component system sensor histidine kinase GlrK